MTEEKKEVKKVEETKGAEENKANTSTNTQTNESKQSDVQSMRYSGFWVRGAAFLIDNMIIVFITVIVVTFTSAIIGFISLFLGNVGALLQFIINFFGLFIAWGYFIFMTHKYQATFGKMAVGVKVYGEDGKKLSLGNVILRETVGKFVSSIIFGIGYIMVAFTDKKQGLHDFIAHSVVTYNNPVKGPNTVAVAITYVVYSIIFFFGVLFMILMFTIFGFIIAGSTDGVKGFINEFEKGLVEDNVNNNYDFNIDDLQNFEESNMPGIEKTEMIDNTINIDELQNELEKAGFLKTL